MRDCQGEVNSSGSRVILGGIMSDSDSLLAGVRVFMTEEEALWYEFEHGVSQQGSSSEGNPCAGIPSARVLSEAGAGPSGRVT